MKIISSISRVMCYVSMGVVGIMVLSNVLDIFMRYIFSRPITGAVEAAEYMMVCVVFFGLALCALQEKHVRVELAMSRFSPKVQAIIDIIVYLLSLGLCVILSWQSLLESFAQHRENFTSQFLKVPTFPFYVVEAIGFAALCLAIVTLLIRKVEGLFEK